MGSKREKLLLVAFVSALLLAGGVIGGSFLVGTIKGQRALLAQRQIRLEEAEAWNADREMWLSRGEWLKQHPLPTYDGQQSEAAFVQEIQASVSAGGIEIVEQRIQESSSQHGIVEVGIDLVVQSGLEPFVRWLHDIRRAGAYRAIRHVRIRGDGQGSTIRAEVSIVRYYETP